MQPLLTQHYAQLTRFPLMTLIHIAHALRMTCYSLPTTHHHTLRLRVTTSCDLLRPTTTHYDSLPCTVPYDYTPRPTVYYALLLVDTYISMRCTSTKYYLLLGVPLIASIDDYGLLLLTVVTCHNCFGRARFAVLSVIVEGNHDSLLSQALPYTTRAQFWFVALELELWPSAQLTVLRGEAQTKRQVCMRLSAFTFLVWDLSLCFSPPPPHPPTHPVITQIHSSGSGSGRNSGSD